MKVNLIVAVSENGVIGKDNNLIWHLPKDMNFFKEKTLGHHVIKNYKADGCVIVNSIEDALDFSRQNGEKETFIIGGGQIYKIALDKNLIDIIYLTKIHHSFNGDTFFPELGLEWEETNSINCYADEKHAYDYSFLTFKKNK